MKKGYIFSSYAKARKLDCFSIQLWRINNVKFYQKIWNRKDITAVGGNTKSLRTWKDVTRMLNNNGGYSSMPY